MTEWAFLDEWFQQLKGSLRIYETHPDSETQDAVRLGRDDEELWIEVRVQDSNATTSEQRRARCRMLHEALVLTSIVAAADYGAWRDALLSTCNLKIPASLGIGALSRRRLQPQFRVQLPSRSAINWIDIQQLLTNDEPSIRFQEHVAMATEIAARRNVTVDTAMRVPVRVFDGPICDDREDQVARLRIIIDAVKTLQNLEDQRPAGSVLRLHSIDLSLHNFDVHSRVLHELLELLETGVPISCLSMPSNFPDDGNTDGSTRLQSWALLACAMCGRPQRRSLRPVHVEKLVLGSIYTIPDMFRSLFSVLNQAQTLKFVKLSASSSFMDPHGVFWLWLGYALFRANSSCSVDVLNLDLVVLSSSAVGNIRDVIAASDPLELIWNKTTQSETEGDSVPAEATRQQKIPVIVPAGTSILPYGSQPGNYGRRFDVPVDWEGVVIDDDASMTTMDVLLYGIGFCEIERVSLPNKRQRIDQPQALPVAKSTETHHGVRSLFLGMLSGDDEDDDDDEPSRVDRTPCQVDALLEVIGDSITGLSLTDASVDDELLERCLNQCPRLHSLRLEGCALKTLEPIMQSYESGGQISSLELNAIQVTPAFLPHFESFLSALLIPGAMKRTLKRLRIGHQWASLFRPSTAEVMKDVLNDPLTLDYLHLYRCENPRIAPPTQWDVVRHHDELIPKRGAPPLDVRVAFASVLKYLRSTNANFARLDTAVLSPAIFEFVGQTTHRVVVSEANTYYNSRMFAIRRAE